MSELQDRLEQLARRGSPRGDDTVLAAAQASVGQDAVAVVGMDKGRSRGPRRHFSSLVAAAGVAATLFVGTLAFSAFLGSGSGSDSPEGAVRQLAGAVSQEDPIAAADVLVPEEVRSLSQTVDGAARRAQELELARSAVKPLAGLDLSVDNLELSSETMADGYVKVNVSSGVLSTHTDTSLFAPALQRALRDSHEPGQVDLASLARDLDVPTFVMTVRRGGHWYVSAAYTTLEYIRVANHLPPADFGSGARATATLGADSPDAAVQDAMHALASQDWRTLISIAPPDEIPVYDYRDALVELGRDEQNGFTINQLETASTVDGDTAKVTLHAAGTDDSGAWQLDGGCFKPPLYEGRLVSTGDWCDSPFFIPYYGSRPETTKAATVTVVRKDGRWFVSAVGTVLDLVDQYVNDLTRRQLYTLLDVPERLPSDGTLTLGTPVTLGDSFGGAYVYDLAAHRGDRLLALTTSTGSLPPDDYYFGAEVGVYSPDGELLRTSFRLIDGEGLVIPADGTYKVVVRPYLEGARFTIWDAANAPDAAKHPPEEAAYQGCEPTSNGGMTCSSSASSSSSGSQRSPASTATSVPGG